jgi:hypothetical protein
MTMFGDKGKTFDQLVTEATAGEALPPLHWYLVAYLDKETGQFLAAVIVQGRSWDQAVKVAIDIRCEKAEKMGKIVEIPAEIPADRLPAEQYRNRILTRSEIDTIWPTANGRK